MMCAKRTRIAAPGLVLAAMGLAVPANPTTPAHAGGRVIVLAHAMIPRTGMMDAQKKAARAHDIANVGKPTPAACK